LPIDEAISQMLAQSGPSEIPRLFHYAQLVLAVAVNEGPLWRDRTPRKFWHAWREARQGRGRAARRAHEQASDRRGNRTDFQSFDVSVWRHSGRCCGCAAIGGNGRPWWGVSVTEQDRLLYSLCQPARLLGI